MFLGIGVGLGNIRRIGFSVSQLFANGQQGAWFDPSDLSTLFQDSAGTTPVTADGDPVGLMQDKSGNGNHASQSTAAARPIYHTDGTLHWLEFDGSDDQLVTTFNPTTSGIMACGSKANDLVGTVVWFTGSTTDPRTYLGSDTGKVLFGAGAERYVGALSSGSSHVTLIRNNSDSGMSLYENGELTRSAAYSAYGTGTALMIGGASTFLAQNFFYGGVFSSGSHTDAKAKALSNYLAKKAGV